MNNHKKIAVYYIATGDYKKLFPEFLESLQNFYPSYYKIVKLISDGLEEYKTYEQGNVKVDLCPRINNYPWPVIALYKMWHILENFDPSYDYACYFNSNAIIHEHDENIFDLNKITVSYHSFHAKSSPYDPWPHIHINPYSSAYLENGTYEYIQSGFFIGPNDLIFEMCKEIMNLLKKDTSRCIFAEWHDESYLNKWCYTHPDLVDKKYIMTVYQKDLDSERFIFLRDKRDYSIMK